jgi:glutathionylspermidine synthase
VRALITEPAMLPIARYRRFVQRAQILGLLADHLYAGEPYLALNAVVLEPEESALLRWLSETFATAFDRAGRMLAPNVPGLEGMGFPWVAAELLAAEEPRMPLVGRFDFVRDGDGHWWLLEFNADTPSGVREAIVADRLVHELLPEACALHRPSACLEKALIEGFRAGVSGMPAGSALGLVTDAGELEDLAQMAFTQELLRAPLAELGIDVILGDADNLRTTHGNLTLCGRRISALYRYLPFEWILGTPGFAVIYDGVAKGRVRLLNGLYGLLLQHKSLLAWLWAHRDDHRFAITERDAIHLHLPPAWPLGQYPDEVRRSELVAKQVFGREGEEVFFGEDLTAEAWQELRRRRTYIAQRRVAVAPIDAVVSTSQGLQSLQGHVTVGSYVVGGRWAGYYTRLGDKITTARAKWIATFVDG